MRFTRKDQNCWRVGLGGLFLAGTFLSAGLCSDALRPPDTASGRSSATPASPGRAASKAGVALDIIRMMDAGVSKEVIQVYVESSSPGLLAPDDLIALKAHAVPDEISTALVKRSAELRSRSAAETSSASGVAIPASVGSPSYGRLDPEGYDFWWYHYAYPRALSYAKERPYPYAQYSPAPFYGSTPFTPGIGCTPVR